MSSISVEIKNKDEFSFEIEEGTEIQVDMFQSSAGMSGVLRSDGSIGLTNNWDAGNYQIRALQFYSDAENGTPPFIVSSTDLVENLNAEYLNGYEASDFSLSTHNHSGIYEPVIPNGEVTQFLRGDKTWQVISTTVTKENVIGLKITDTPEFVSIILSDLTASRAVVTDTSKKLVSASATAQEIDFLSGVSSNIQPQLNGKESSIAAGSSTQYWRGDKSWQTLNKAAVTGIHDDDNVIFRGVVAEPELSDELITFNETLGSGTNWTWTGTRWQHTSGSVVPLTCTFTPDASADYIIEISILAGGSGGVTLTLGSNKSNQLTSGNYYLVLRSTDTAVLIFTPTSSSWTGSITALSILKVLSGGNIEVTAGIYNKSQRIYFWTGNSWTSKIFFDEYDNIGFGVYSDYSQKTSGNKNVFIGNAWVGITTGYRNVGIGYWALSTVTTGYQNVGLGYNALGLLESGYNNTSLGSTSLANLIAGKHNTAIGYGSGNINNSDQNVFVGYFAGSFETGSNKLFIDNQARTNEATGRTNAMIYGEFNPVVASQNLWLNANVYEKNVTLDNLTASMAVVSDATKKLVSSATTSAELAHVSGVTSPIQTQFSGKEDTISTGTTAQYYRGDKTWQTLNQASVAGLTVTDSPTFSDITISNKLDVEIAINGNLDIDPTGTSVPWSEGASTNIGTAWVYDTGTLRHIPGNTTELQNNFSISLVDNTSYIVSFTISGRTAGSISVQLSLLGSIKNSTDSTLNFSSNTTYNLYVNSGGFASFFKYIKFTPTTTFDGKIDNLSIKKSLNLSSFPKIYTNNIIINDNFYGSPGLIFGEIGLSGNNGIGFANNYFGFYINGSKQIEIGSHLNVFNGLHQLKSTYIQGQTNTLQLVNTTNPQTFEVYNTYTSTTNYERGFFRWSGNEFSVGTEKGSGGGTARDFIVSVDGTNRIFFTGITKRVGIGEMASAPSHRLAIDGNLQFIQVLYPGQTEHNAIGITENLGAGTTLLAGQYWYVVTYYTSYGNAGCYANATYQPKITISAGSSISLTNLPISSDPRVVGRRIFRSNVGGDYTNCYLIKTISNNTTTTYTDTGVDAPDLNYQNNKLPNMTAGSMYMSVAPGLAPSLVSTIQSQQTAFGWAALASITSGGENVALGHSSGTALTTGSNNVCVGSSVLNSNVAGTANTGLGYGAIANFTGGNYNAAIGNNSLRGVVAGQSITGNCAFGNQSLYNLVNNSNYNCGYGYQSGYGFRGAYNIFLGYKSGYIATPETIGDNNIFIGYSVGDNATVGADRNILIGYNLDLQSTGADNQLSIGNLIFGTGLDGTGTTVSTGNIGFGVAVPLSRVHANANLIGATGNEVAYRFDYTVNKATSGDDTGFQISMTDTTSPGTSKVFECIINSTPRFYINSSGLVYIGTSMYTSGRSFKLFSDISSGNAWEFLMETNRELTGSSGIQIGFNIENRINQTGTAGAYDFVINRKTETSLGSGTQRLASLQVADVEYAGIDNKGAISSTMINNIDSDTDEIDSVTWAGGYGLLITCSVTDGTSAIWKLEGTTFTTVSVDADWTSTKDNPATYNVYFEAGAIKLQNKVGNDKTVKLGFYGIL